MARVCKSLIPEQGYPHRDHRSKKSRNWKTKIELKKKREHKDKTNRRGEAEIDREEIITQHRKKHGKKI